MIILYQAIFWSDAKLKFEENLYLRYNSDSIYVT